jgi:DNA-binding response OmpR family regulator
MKKRILLVDNEIDFIEVLAESFTDADIPLDVDTAFSVNEAQDKALNRQYDLIITDIRMPHKSGIDLLVFLKEIGYPGLIYAMTAFDAKGNEAQLSSLGAHEVFAKPFSLNWLKRKVELALSGNSRDQVEPIGLISLLQMLNLDRKDVLVQLEGPGDCASIYLQKGEIIHAELGESRGETALMKIIAKAEQSVLFIRPFRQKRLHHSIKLNFLEQMMQVLSLSDELNHRKGQKMAEQEETNQILDPQRVEEMIARARSLKGYWGLAIYNHRGERMAVHCEQESLNLSLIGNQLLDTIFFSSQLSRSTGIGHASMIHIETSDGFSSLLHSHRTPFQTMVHTIMLLQPDADPNLAKNTLLGLCEGILRHQIPPSQPE